MTQLTLDAAHADTLKQAGLDLAETDHLFITLARAEARAISDRRGMVSSDDLRVWASARGLEPRSPNVWGSVFRGPAWEIIGRKKSLVPGNHAREIKVWRWRG